MKIKNVLAVFIIVGGISYALYCSLITVFFTAVPFRNRRG